MNNLEFQKVVDEQLASFIMMTLLIEIGQKIDSTSDENSYVKNLCHLLGISKDRLNKLQTLVFDNDIQILDKATSFNFDTFDFKLARSASDQKNFRARCETFEPKNSAARSSTNGLLTSVNYRKNELRNRRKSYYYHNFDVLTFKLI